MCGVLVVFRHLYFSTAGSFIGQQIYFGRENKLGKKCMIFSLSQNSVFNCGSLSHELSYKVLNSSQLGFVGSPGRRQRCPTCLYNHSLHRRFHLPCRCNFGLCCVLLLPFFWQGRLLFCFSAFHPCSDWCSSVWSPLQQWSQNWHQHNDHIALQSLICLICDMKQCHCITVSLGFVRSFWK